MSLQLILKDGSLYSDLSLVESSSQEAYDLDFGNYNIDTKIVKNTLNDGSVEVGNRVIPAPPVQLKGQFTATSDSNFDSKMNPLLEAAINTEYIYDDVINRRLRVVPKGVNVKSGPNQRKRKGTWSLKFVACDAAWEDFNATLVPLSLAAATAETIVLSNGTKQSFAVITFSAGLACDDIQIVNAANNQVAFIEDPTFGTTADDLVMDNLEGTLLLGDADRKEYFSPGTSFFRLEPGDNNVQFQTNVASEVEISYRKRYFL
jgi:hypothetical protein